VTPADNILYFNNDIDIRICLKNGYTTLRAVWTCCYDPSFYKISKNNITTPSTLYRYNQAMLKQDIWDQPFRRGSYRIAIKRDPVQRFISAMSYLDEVKIEPNFANDKKSYIDLTNVNKNDINSVLDAFDNQTLRDEHFFSQSYFMGHPDQYDKVYDITEMAELLSWLTKKCNPKYPITDIWQNKTKNTDSRIELTDSQTLRIIKLYAKDYANGWY
jgi:hypothetical protein